MSFLNYKFKNYQKFWETMKSVGNEIHILKNGK